MPGRSASPPGPQPPLAGSGARIEQLLGGSELPYGLPVFAGLGPEDYRAAIFQGMAEQLRDVEAVAYDPAPPSLANTLVALERSGVRLDRALRAFRNAVETDTNDALDALDAELAPFLAAHRDAIWLDPALYQRLAAVREAGEALDPESEYLLSRYLKDFMLAGAGLAETGKDQLRALNARIATLQSRFETALNADTRALALVIDDTAALDGLSPGEISAAAAAAAARGLADRHLIALVLPTAHPYLAALTDPTVRERLSGAQRSRGARGNQHDTRAILLELARLRAQRARLLGFENHAALVTADSAAGKPEAVSELLTRLAPPVLASARAEQARLEQYAGQPLRASDWPFYAERVRAADHDLDRAALRPYFEVERVLADGVFFAAGRLFGLRFQLRTDLTGYHPDVRVFEVSERDGTPVGLYLLDLYARERKRGGAWMSALVNRAGLLGSQTAVIVNNLNVPKPAPGEATLLSFDQITTLFHEFGHALHGLLAQAAYPRLAGTNVFRDFVEFPSQFFEMWLIWPEVLANYAFHHQTGEPIPAAVVERLHASTTFNEGFLTGEYLAAAVIDFAWHSLTPEQVPTDPAAIPAFEQAALRALGLDNPALPPRYASPYFAHIFDGGYAAAYYSYIWAELMAADTERWFAENGGLLPENGAAYRRHVIGFGGTRDPLDAYLEWRGRPAPLEPLLAKRGLLGAPASG